MIPHPTMLAIAACCCLILLPCRCVGIGISGDDTWDKYVSFGISRDDKNIGAGVSGDDKLDSAAMVTPAGDVTMVEDESTTTTPSFSSLLPDGARRIILDLGANLDPIRPTDDDSSLDVHVLAFEPVLSLHSRAYKHPRVHMIPAAVSSTTGLRVFRTYNNNALSSSLSEVTKGMKDGEDYWNTDVERGDGQRSLVSSLSLSLVLTELQNSGLEVSLIKTDIQGADFETIRSAGEGIRAVGWLVTEVAIDNVRSYQNVENDLCRDWVPYMTKMRYKLELLVCHSQMASCGSVDDGTSWQTNTLECCRRNIMDHTEPTSGTRECDVIWSRVEPKAPDVLPPSPPLRKEKWIKRFVDRIIAAKGS